MMRPSFAAYALSFRARLQREAVQRRCGDLVR